MSTWIFSNHHDDGLIISVILMLILIILVWYWLYFLSLFFFKILMVMDETHWGQDLDECFIDDDVIGMEWISVYWEVETLHIDHLIIREHLRIYQRKTRNHDTSMIIDQNTSMIINHGTGMIINHDSISFMIINQVTSMIINLGTGILVTVSFASWMMSQWRILLELWANMSDEQGYCRYHSSELALMLSPAFLRILLEYRTSSFSLWSHISSISINDTCTQTQRGHASQNWMWMLQSLGLCWSSLHLLGSKV